MIAYRQAIFNFSRMSCENPAAIRKQQEAVKSHAEDRNFYLALYRNKMKGNQVQVVLK